MLTNGEYQATFTIFLDSNAGWRPVAYAPAMMSVNGRSRCYLPSQYRL